MHSIFRKCAIFLTLALGSLGGYGAPASAQILDQSREGRQVEDNGSALAQQRDDGGGRDITVITVTAQRREERLKDVPFSIQALSAVQLENAQVRDLNDVAALVPGASTISSDMRGSNMIQIRGISGGATGDATTGYYIDNIPFFIPNLSFAPPTSPTDLQRVEIVRGPFGTLYGNGAMGGLIQLVSIQPDLNGFHMRGQAEISSIKDSGDVAYASDAMINIPVAPVPAAIRISGGYRHLAGFADSRGQPGDRDLNSAGGRHLHASMRIEPSRSLNIVLSYWHSSDRQNYGNTLTSIDPPLLATSFGATPLTQISSNLYSASLKAEIGDVEIQSATSYIDYGSASDNIVASGTSQVRIATDFQNHSFNEEVRFLSRGDTDLKWTAGASYTDAKLRSAFGMSLPVDSLKLSLPILTQNPSPLTSRFYAFFGEVSYRFPGTEIVALAGLRYFHDRRFFAGSTSFFQPGIPTPLLVTGELQGSFRATSPRFNVSYKVAPDVMFYLNAANGFRSGTILSAGQIAVASTAGIDASEFIRPDSLWTYEFGTKASLTRHLSVDFAAYRTEWSSIQQPLIAGGLAFSVNVGDGRLTGLDLGLRWESPINGLVISMAGNIVGSRFTRVAPAIAARLPSAQRGQRLPNVPKTTVSIEVDFSRPLNGDVNLNLHAAVGNRGSQRDLASGFESASLTNASIWAGISFRSYEARLFVRNLTDERGPALLTSSGPQTLYPRELGAMLIWHY